MEKVLFEYRGSKFELFESKDLFGCEVIVIYENERLVGTVEKLHSNELYIVTQRILSGKYSYQELGVYA